MRLIIVCIAFVYISILCYDSTNCLFELLLFSLLVVIRGFVGSCKDLSVVGVVLLTLVVLFIRSLFVCFAVSIILVVIVLQALRSQFFMVMWLLSAHSLVFKITVIIEEGLNMSSYLEAIGLF